MWIIVMFDLPVSTAKLRKAYNQFRKYLLAEGFAMLQFSVYARYCESHEHADTFLRHIHDNMPKTGQVRILLLTEKQFSDITVFADSHVQSAVEPPDRFLLF